AALAVAVLRALAAAAARRLARDEEIEIATRLEAIFHGHPSGVDPAGAALGGCFRFVRGTPPAIIAVRPAVPLPLVIAFGARPRSTGAAVGGLRGRRRRHKVSATEGRLALVGGSTTGEGLGERVDHTIARASQYLFSTQHARGYWHAPLEANVTMEAEYVFFNRLLGRTRPDVERR